MDIFLVFLLWTVMSSVKATLRPCILKHFGDDRWVCVCNSTYCDTIDRVPKIDKGTYVFLESTKSGIRFHQNIEYFKHTSTNNSLIYTVNSSHRYQQLLGFGAAFTDSVGVNILSLSTGSQENLIRSYFSVYGSEYSLGRVPIGGTDFSLNGYSLDDSDAPDPELEHFSLSEADYIYKIPIIHRAVSASDREITFLAASWSCPTWMKTYNEMLGFYHLNPEYYRSYADYHIRFLDEYKKNGVKIGILSTQNQPMAGVTRNSSDVALGWLPSEIAHWVVNYLGPQLKASDHKDVQIVTFDDQRFYLPWWIDWLINSNAEVINYVSGFALHWYFDFLVDVGVVKDLHDQHPDKFLLYTESCTGNLPWEDTMIIGSWDRGELYMKSIIENINAWVSGWMDWNMCLDVNGGPSWVENYVDSPILVNATADEFYKQPMYYALAHVSKFIDKNAHRIEMLKKQSTMPDMGLDVKLDPFNEVYAFASQNPDGRIVIVLANRNYEKKDISIYHPEKGHICRTLQEHSFNTILL